MEQQKRSTSQDTYHQNGTNTDHRQMNPSRLFEVVLLAMGTVIGLVWVGSLVLSSPGMAVVVVAFARLPI
jgi:hypothetical protein